MYKDIISYAHVRQSTNLKHYPMNSANAFIVFEVDNIDSGDVAPVQPFSRLF